MHIENVNRKLSDIRIVTFQTRTCRTFGELLIEAKFEYLRERLRSLIFDDWKDLILHTVRVIVHHNI